MDLFLQQGTIYTKTAIMSPNKEINFRNLQPEEKKLFEEAMAREVAEVLRSQALRAVQGHVDEQVIKDRLIPMRWVLTWKFIPSTVDTSSTTTASTTASSMTSSSATTSHGTNGKTKNKKKPSVMDEQGKYKAKARLVLLGFKHPDLAGWQNRTTQTCHSTNDDKNFTKPSTSFSTG